MSLQILSLNSNQVPACAAAQEKILALLSSGEGAMEPKQFGTAKELFYALAEALKTAQTILLLVEPDRYLRTKEQLLRAMGLSTVPNPELMEALQKSPVQLPEEDFSRHAAIPVGAAAFPTQDGLFAGFMLTAGRQTILFLPLDNRRIDSILKAEAGAFLSGSQLGRQTRETQPQAEQKPKQANGAPAQGESENRNEPEELAAQAAAPGQYAQRAMEALEAKDLRIAFAKTPTVEFLKEAAGENELAARRLIYSNAFCEPDEGSAKQYAAELARRAMQEEGTPLGAAITNVYTVKKEGRVETFLLIAVAEESGAQVRQLYAQPDEHPGLLIGDGVQALYELVEQVVKKGSDKLEARPAHWKAFAAVLSVLLSLSILLCIGTGVLLRFQENRSSQQVSLSSAHAPAGQQATQPSDPENAQASFDIGQQTTDAETQADSSTAVRLPTASALKKPAVPAKDQAILDEVAQAMEDELNSGGKKEEESSKQPDTTAKPETTTGKGNADSSQTTPPSSVPSDEISTAHPSSQRKSGKFQFTVYGYGHGVGMSQFGANEFAKSGWNYREILLHYFPGVQMQKMDGCYPETLEVNGQQVDTKVVLARILEKEMGGSYHLEALKAQAVAAYTYILRQNRVTGVAIGSTYSARAMQAVEEVLGEYMTYNGEPILATFFAYSAGKTADVRTVWGGSGYPYLQGGCTSPGDKNHKNYKTTYTITSEALRSRVKSALGIELAGDPAQWLKIKSHDAAVSGSVGYVSVIQVGSKTMSGQDFRAKVMDYDIRSHCFTITYVPDS